MGWGMWSCRQPNGFSSISFVIQSKEVQIGKTRKDIFVSEEEAHEIIQPDLWTQYFWCMDV